MARQLLMMVLVAAMSLCWTGCSVDETKPVDTTPAMSDAQALEGTWRSGNHSISFGGGRFSWNLPRRCGAPPCPTTAWNGTYEIRNGRIYLDPSGPNNDHMLEFRITWNPRNLWFKSPQLNEEWTLTFGG